MKLQTKNNIISFFIKLKTNTHYRIKSFLKIQVIYNCLYAIFLYGDTEITYDLYKYYNGEFVFDNELYNKIHQVKYNNYIIGGKAEFKGNMYFTTGYLYVTNDMTNFTRIDFPNEKTVYDICIYKNKVQNS